MKSQVKRIAEYGHEWATNISRKAVFTAMRVAAQVAAVSTALALSNLALADCVSPWGTPVSNGLGVTAYKSSYPAPGEHCVSEYRICSNGWLSGSYTYMGCTEPLPPSFEDEGFPLAPTE